LHQFTIKENLFENLPHRNLNPIKVLFDVLDVRSIMQCWKALLFDKWVSFNFINNICLANLGEFPSEPLVLGGRGLKAAFIPTDLAEQLDHPG
jgi:hypothetical protein